MGLLSSKIQQEELKPGDHIYTWRSGYSYSHHGIYAGEGKVVHLTRAPGLIIFSSSPPHPSGEDRVVCCSIQEFLSGGDLYVYEYGVKQARFLVKRGGTCSRFSGDPPEDVLRRVFILLEKGFGDYDLFQNNCEDFANYCKTGLLKVEKSDYGNSGQSKFLFATLTAIIFTPFHFLPVNLVWLALVVYGLTCGFRLVEPVFEKVEAENLSKRKAEIEESDSFQLSERLGIAREYIVRALIVNIWSWAPTSRILLWIRLALIYMLSISYVSDVLRDRYGLKLKLREHTAYMIWLLGYWYWSSGSESTIFLWTKLFFLVHFLKDFLPKKPTGVKLEDYIAWTVYVLPFWYWTPKSRLLLWIRLGFIYYILYTFFKHDLMKNHGSKVDWFFSVCFVIQSAVLFWGLDFTDYYSFRIAKSIINFTW